MEASQIEVAEEVDVTLRPTQAERAAALLQSSTVLRVEQVHAEEEEATKVPPSLGFLESPRAFGSVHQAALLAAQAADKLYEQAQRTNELDAHRRTSRAVQAARRHASEFPGHEFGRNQPEVSLLNRGAALQPSAEASLEAIVMAGCGANCSGHGVCHDADGTCECQAGWIGAFCDTVPCPDDCNGNGLCISGTCMCDHQHFGLSCQHERCIGDCSGHGYCFQARCQCTGDYGGESCSEVVHSGSVIRFKLPEKRPILKGAPAVSMSTLRSIALPGCATSCSGHGRCLQGGLGGCGCDEGWSGAECSDFCPSDCSGHGDCIHGSCLCLSGWSRADCAQQSCCSGHGSCATPDASCGCDHGWAGAECNIELLCPDASCSGHGICTHGSCMCGPGYSGAACEISHRACNGMCGEHGTCDTNTERCECAVGWTGPYCTVPPPQGLFAPLAPEPSAGTDAVMVVEHHPEQAQVLCEHGLMLIQGADGKVSCGDPTTPVDRASDHRVSVLAETRVSREVSTVPTTGSWIPVLPATKAAEEKTASGKVAEEKVLIEPIATNVSDSLLHGPISGAPSTRIVKETLETFDSSPSVLGILTAASPAANLLGSASSSARSKTDAPLSAAALPAPETRDEEELIRLLEVGRPATTADDAKMPVPPSAQSAAASERRKQVGLIEAAHSQSKLAVAKPQVSLLGLLTSAAGLRASQVSSNQWGHAAIAGGAGEYHRVP